MIIKFQIIKSVVIDAVKATTYLKAKVDSAQDERAVKLGFNEAAGDDEVHERTLTHDFQTALEMVKTILAEYVVPTSQSTGDNVIYYEEGKDEVVTFTLDASRRCNGTLTDTLARLAAKYVEDYMTYSWWLKTTNLKQAEPYQAALAVDEQGIRRCFVLRGPKVPAIPYTTKLTAKVDGSDDEGTVVITKGDPVTLSYGLSDGAIDDIEARSSDESIVAVERSAEIHSFELIPVNTGVATVTLFSRHNDKLDTTTEVVVSMEGGEDGIQ